jgi:hypothetical protein
VNEERITRLVDAHYRWKDRLYTLSPTMIAALGTLAAVQRAGEVFRSVRLNHNTGWALVERGLARCHDTPSGQRTYRITIRGKIIFARVDRGL